MRRLAALSAMALLLVACSGGSGKPLVVPARPTTTAGPAAAPVSAAETTTTTPAAPQYTAVTAAVSRVAVYDEPGDTTPSRTFAHPNPTYGTPRVFLVVEEQADWLKVMLPARPNGSTGWIRRSDVTPNPPHSYRIVVELGAHKLTVYDGKDVFLEAPVGTGRSATPSTLGTFYTTELIEVLPDQRSAYGPYAYGLSAYSEVLFTFGGGDGQMGIHGTGDPSSVGSDVSNGCIRMYNETITKLAETLPIGVPVEIRA
jgi:lipoprotein-anchoring transpeptidase ErfK/SrfK